MHTRELLKQEFQVVKLESSLREFYGRHDKFIDRYGISVAHMTTYMFPLSLLSSRPVSPNETDQVRPIIVFVLI